MARRFYQLGKVLFNYDGSISRLKNIELVLGKVKTSVYSIIKKGRKIIRKFIGYVSKIPKKLIKQSERKVREKKKRDLKREIKRRDSELTKPKKGGLSREAVYSIGQAQRDSEYYIDLSNQEKPIYSQNLQSAINFDWILRHLEKDGMLTPEKIKEIMDDDYEFTSVSKYARDLFNAYQDSDMNGKSRLWD